MGGVLRRQPVVQTASYTFLGEKFRHFHDMEPLLSAHEIDVIQRHQVQMLLWGHHQSPPHRMSKNYKRFVAEATIIPSTVIVFKAQVPRIIIELIFIL